MQQKPWHHRPAIIVALGNFAAEPELLDKAIAAANAADDQRTEPLRREQAALLARVSETRTKVARLVDAIAEGGAGFQSIRAKLTLESATCGCSNTTSPG